MWGGMRVQDRRREKGSGIGKSHEEGGTNEESPIRKRGGDGRAMQREVEKVGGRNRLRE